MGGRCGPVSGARACPRRHTSIVRVSIALVAFAHLLPLFGHLALGWDVKPLLLAFLLENTVLVFFGILRVLVTLHGFRPERDRRVTYWRDRPGREPFIQITAEYSGVGSLILAAFVLGAMILGCMNYLAMIAFGGLVEPEDAIRLLRSPGEWGWVVVVLVAEHGWASFRAVYRDQAWMRSDPVFHSRLPFGRMFFLLASAVVAVIATFVFKAPSATLAGFLLLKGGIEIWILIHPPAPWRRDPPIPELT